MSDAGYLQQCLQQHLNGVSHSVGSGNVHQPTITRTKENVKWNQVIDMPSQNFLNKTGVVDSLFFLHFFKVKKHYL